MYFVCRQTADWVAGLGRAGSDSAQFAEDTTRATAALHLWWRGVKKSRPGGGITPNHYWHSEQKEEQLPLAQLNKGANSADAEK